MKIFQFYKDLDQWEPSLDNADQWECSTLLRVPIYDGRYIPAGLHLSASLPPRVRLWPCCRWARLLLQCRDWVCAVSVSAPGLRLRSVRSWPGRFLCCRRDLQGLQVWATSPSWLWLWPGVGQPGLSLSWRAEVGQHSQSPHHLQLCPLLVRPPHCMSGRVVHSRSQIQMKDPDVADASSLMP